ncbi:uncharacterized protein LOC127721924 [Mytilus californianus]|uniref:uncharacterized protein LOC127721924 n=1 Tax=Mytilus californianus TaxID=6549 RepID=UPI002246107E|nr:uncharacterized protein LOC127721924 [Mytilus californianus]
MLTFNIHNYSWRYLYDTNLNRQEYKMVFRPILIQIQMINVTASDTGHYYLCSNHRYISATEFNKKLAETTYEIREGKQRVITRRSSEVLSYITDLFLCHDGNEVVFSRRKNFRKFSTFTLHVYSTPAVKGFLALDLSYVFSSIVLKIAKLWFINQTDLNTIVGQEGTPMEIKCSSDTEQYITALKLEYKDSIIAVGDNQYVSFLFIPDRTDHMTKCKCLDSTHSSMMIEVQLIIMYAPAVTVRYTNETVECDGHGNPEIYNVYRLVQLSKSFELVRSVSLNNETFIFNTNLFPYQRNGRYMCVVSNGIPDINGKVLQTESIYLKYEGPPVFSPENRIVKTGEVGQSITLSFQIYSYPEVENISIEKIGQNQKKYKKDKKYNIRKSTLHYTETGNMVGIPGYEILIETEALEVDDFQAYLITAKNRLGESNYHFEIIDIDSLPLGKSKRINFVVVCCIATILLVYLTITHVCLCVKYVKTRDQRLHNLQEDHTYHTYDEIDTVSFRVVSNLRSAQTTDNLGQNPTEGHTAGVSTDANLQSTNEYTTELNADFLNDGLQQHEITEVHGQSMSTPLIDTNLSNTDLSPITSSVILRMENVANCNQTNENTETSSEQKSKTCNDSDSGSSNNVMVGNVRNEYENNYQLQDGHLYLDILDDRQISISATDSSTNNQQKSQTINASYRRPSYNDMVGNVRNEYENNYQLQDGHQNLESIDDRQINNSTTNFSTNKQQKSQISKDFDSGSSNSVMVGNVRNDYENNFQLQDGHLYLEILYDRQINISSTDSNTKTQQRSQTRNDSDSGPSNNVMVGNVRNEYENNYQLQDGHLLLEILDDRQTSISSTDSSTNNQQKSQTINAPYRRPSYNDMVGNVRNEYENNYQLQDGHLLLEILDDRQTSISSTDSNKNEQQPLETISTTEPVYINL